MFIIPHKKYPTQIESTKHDSCFSSLEYYRAREQESHEIYIIIIKILEKKIAKG